jgi:hypothetical protein
MTSDDRASGPAGDAAPEEAWDDQPSEAPRLAPGVRWSDILAEIERDNEQLDEAA